MKNFDKNGWVNFANEYAETVEEVKLALSKINEVHEEMNNWNLLDLTKESIIKSAEDGYPLCQISANTDAEAQAADLQKFALNLVAASTDLIRLIARQNPEYIPANDEINDYDENY